jgi:hypothetical protein
MLLADLGISLALALAFAAVPWLARWIWTPFLVGLLVGAILSPNFPEVSLTMYPWSDFVVAALALLGGILLGRVMPPRFRPTLILLLVLSALDVAQIVLTSGAAPPTTSGPATDGDVSGWFALANYVIRLPAHNYKVGILDLLLITALAEHWRRRAASYVLALVPGAIGFALAYVFAWLTNIGGLPLAPFFTAGWLCAEGVHRARSHRHTSADAAVS